MIINGQHINDLRISPANRLEKLKKELKGMLSQRVIEKLRIIFKWQTSHAYDVQINEYHYYTLIMANTLKNIYPGEVLLEEFDLVETCMAPNTV